MKKNSSNLILGGGISGLTTGLSTGWPVFEAGNKPGGICLSYTIDGYRFEIGGGHWIFGANDATLSFINKFTHLKNYVRHSSVYFNKEKLTVPYPVQNNLRFLNKRITARVLEEISNTPHNSFSTMKKWLAAQFGPTLCKLFFYPFHDLYTTKLYTKIAPQDAHKSPVNIKLVKQGAKSNTLPIGYNVNFVYPKEGLNALAGRMAKDLNIHYGKRAVKIDVKEKKVYFADGSIFSYSQLISTLPLNKMMEMAGLSVDQEPDPYTSVLVLNIGAVRGDKCPEEHWLYNPQSRSEFYRVGFYSNIDTSFLPTSLQKSNNYVSVYVERAYPGGYKPSGQEIKAYADSVVRELQEWNFIDDIEVLDPKWIDVAYTWSWQGSTWKEKALALLNKHSIHQLGRYGRWHFQGIAESIREGLFFGKKAIKR